MSFGMDLFGYLTKRRWKKQPFRDSFLNCKKSKVGPHQYQLFPPGLADKNGVPRSILII